MWVLGKRKKNTSEVEFIMFLEDVHGNMELIIIPNKNLLVYNSKASLLIETSC